MINYARDHTTQDGLDYVAIWNASHFHRDEFKRQCKPAQNLDQVSLQIYRPFEARGPRINGQCRVAPKPNRASALKE